jgi:hypothetical protein
VTLCRLIFALIVSLVVIFSALIFFYAEAQAKDRGGGGDKSTSTSDSGGSGGGGDSGGSANKDGGSDSGGDKISSTLNSGGGEGDGGGGGGDDKSTSTSDSGGSGSGGDSGSDLSSGGTNEASSLGNLNDSNSSKTLDAGSLSDTQVTDNDPVTRTTTDTVSEPVSNATDTISPATDTLGDAVTPATDAVEGAVSPTTDTLGDAVSPITGTLGDAVTPVVADPLASFAEPLASVNNDPPAQPFAPIINEPVLEAAAMPQMVEPVATPLLEESTSALATASNVQQPVLEGSAQGASYSLELLPAPAVSVDVDQGAPRGAADHGWMAEIRVAKTDGSLGSHPRLFDTSHLIGGQLAALTAEASAAVKGLQNGIPNPLLPFGFPSGMPPVGSTFSGSSGIGIGLDLLAVLALILILSRIDRSSMSPREGFRLVSSPRLVTELPG